MTGNYLDEKKSNIYFNLNAKNNHQISHTPIQLHQPQKIKIQKSHNKADIILGSLMTQEEASPKRPETAATIVG